MKAVEGLHLRVEDASVRLDDADSLVESLKRIRRSLAISHHSGQVQLQILGLEDGRKAVADAVARSGWDLNIVTRRGQITEDLGTLCVGGGP